MTNPLPQSTSPDIQDDILQKNSWEIITHTGYKTTFAWMLIIGAATFLASAFTLPAHYVIPTTLLGVLLGLIAAVDNKTYLIKNTYVLTAVLITSISLITLATLNQISWWNLLWGTIGGIIMLGIFFALHYLLGFSSGGDMKLAPVIAVWLTSINPLLPFIWLMLAFIMSLLHLTITKKKHIAFGVGMALAFPASIPVTAIILQLAGYSLG